MHARQACGMTARATRPHLERCKHCGAAPIRRRFIQINSTPAIGNPEFNDALSEQTQPTTLNPDSPDARFEVLGAPSSLLSVTLSASQNLFTRRGTLVGLTGKAENVMSTLSMLEPFRRAFLRIPFVYQKISSTSPITALLATKSPLTTFAVVHMNGTVDWMVAQRKALLAWTGHTMSVRPTVNRKMSLAHWGNSEVTGRGLMALVGNGQVYQISLKTGEEFVAHPSNVVAYTITQKPPLPYRLKSSVFRLQVPSFNPSALLPDTKFFRVMRDSPTWRGIGRAYYAVRTWSRRTIWGDRLFLRFEGPVNILLQSRASRLSDVLTTRDVNEIAATEPGAIQETVQLADRPRSSERKAAEQSEGDRPTGMSVASVGKDGKVAFRQADDFEPLLRRQ